jgi:ATP-dependent RNA circularization protein (DNA/RNA ligase family)
MHTELIKFPRTKHISGSMLQTGDGDLRVIPFEQIQGKYVVLEEKTDGANSGISFSESGQLLLQSRGYFLEEKNDERQFELLKLWANQYKKELYELLGSSYIMYGEWMYAKHTIYYDRLPHYFMEFDIYDKRSHLFLNTQKRRELLKKYPFIHSARVAYEGQIENVEHIRNLIGPSPFISENSAEKLKKTCQKQGIDFQKVEMETDFSGIMEGIYIKVENEETVTERYKYVRETFKTQVVDTETHWIDKPIIENQLADSESFIMI